MSSSLVVSRYRSFAPFHSRVLQQSIRSCVVKPFGTSSRPDTMSRDLYKVNPAHLDTLRQYTACDVSDALLKLKVPGAGFLPDLSLVARHSAAGNSGAPHAVKQQIAIAPAATVLFVPKGTTLDSPPANIPSGAHWVDLTPAGSFVVLQQPEGQTNAVCGGIMAARMAKLGAQGVAALGRARDVDELNSTGLPIWSRGLSTVGTGASTQAWAVQTPITAPGGAVVNPGDLVFSDTTNGVVVIPREKVEQVLDLLPKLTAADDKVKEAVLGGMSVQEAFKLHRSGL